MRAEHGASSSTPREFATGATIMNNELEVIAEEGVLEVHAVGKLTKEFYQAFVPAVEKQIEEFGKLRVLFVMKDFHGWTAGALWEDVKFDLKHWKDIERLAIVGESEWEKGMAAFCKPFTMAKVKYFDHSQIDEARRWLESGE
jgi:SpoIIAA-like